MRRPDPIPRAVTDAGIDGGIDAGLDRKAVSPPPPENPDRVLVAEAIRWSLTEVPVHANPVAEAMRMTLVSAERARVRLRFDIDYGFTQGDGVIQGGILAAMLDFGMAFAALSVVGEGESVATVGINVHYLRPAQVGRYEVEAHLEKTGKRIVFARADLFRDNGEPVASASAPVTIIARRKAPAA